MPIWLIAIGAALSALGCGRIGFETGSTQSGLGQEWGSDDANLDAGNFAETDAYYSNCSPDAALQRLCMGVDGGY